MNTATKPQSNPLATVEALSLSSDLQDACISTKKSQQRKKASARVNTKSKNMMVGQKRSHTRMQEDPNNDAIINGDSET